MGSSAQIMWGVIFGGIGTGYFIYGKKQHQIVAMFSGIALCFFSYFVSSAFLIVLIGIVLMALPFFIKS